MQVRQSGMSAETDIPQRRELVPAFMQADGAGSGAGGPCPGS